MPIHVPGAAAADFSFPGGFIEEGAIYCVSEAGRNSHGGWSLRLVGCPVIRGQTEIWWDGVRFRRLENASGEIRQRRRKESPTALAKMSS
jgi:hypothetical protein